MTFRETIGVCILALFASAGSGELIKPIEMNKKSEFQTKQFETKDLEKNQFETGQFRDKGRYKTQPYDSRQFSHSSKTYRPKVSVYPSKQFPVVDIPYKKFDKRDKRFETKSYDTKEVEKVDLPARVADKPSTSWQTMIRKTPPTGMPGKPNDVPFSHWKATSEEK